MSVAPRIDGVPAPPIHIAIIMDGNGRWAKARGLPRIAGHQRGARAVRAAVEAARSLGIQYLTLYTFSSENWKRPAAEINDLMGLMRLYIKRELADLHRNNVRMRFIGDPAPLPADIQELIADATRTTSGNTGLNLIIALNYGGQNEIVKAVQSLAEKVAAGNIHPDDITPRLLADHLDTAGIPDPDLMIRTSGEQRLSNFLLWQLAYSELVFLDTLWPDFTSEDMAQAIAEFQRRERRYGAASA